VRGKKSGEKDDEKEKEREKERGKERGETWLEDRFFEAKTRQQR